MFEDANFGKGLTRGDPDLLDKMIRENCRNWKSLAYKHGSGKYGFKEGDAISIIGQALVEFLEDLNTGEDRRGGEIPALTVDSYEVIKKKIQNKVQYVAKRQRDEDAGKIETKIKKEKKQREKEKLELAKKGDEFGESFKEEEYEVISTNVEEGSADMDLEDSSSSTADTDSSKKELLGKVVGRLSERCRALFELKLIHEAALVKTICKENSKRLASLIAVAESIATETGETVDNIRRRYWKCSLQLAPQARKVFTNKERTRTLWDDWCDEQGY